MELQHSDRRGFIADVREIHAEVEECLWHAIRS